jgi:hypothetical protein
MRAGQVSNSKPHLRRLLRDRIAATIPEGSGAEIKNLCEALYTLEGKGAAPQAPGPQRLTVRFEGEAADYSL